MRQLEADCADLGADKENSGGYHFKKDIIFLVQALSRLPNVRVVSLLQYLRVWGILRDNLKRLQKSLALIYSTPLDHTEVTFFATILRTFRDDRVQTSGFRVHSVTPAAHCTNAERGDFFSRK